MQGEKRVAYDELSIPEWAVDQLTNIFYMQDPDIIKKALLQTILALKDANSLAGSQDSIWHIHARSGTSWLSWDDQMQCSINRLSASQIAMANVNISNHPAKPEDHNM